MVEFCQDTLKIDPTECAARLDGECEGKRGEKDACKVFGLSR